VQGLQGAALQVKVQALHMGDFEKCPRGRGSTILPWFWGASKF